MRPYYQDKWVTIYHGDCRFMPEAKFDNVDLGLTDPPYDIEADDLKYIWGIVASRMKDKGNLIWTFNSCRLQVIGQSLIPAFMEIRTAVWHKPFCPSPWRFGWSWHWEPIIWWMKGNDKTGISQYKFTEPDVISFDVIRPTDFQRTNHHDQKPEALWAKIIAWFSKPNDLILDPFLGSGTTTFCAKKLGRQCIGIEIEERYCEIAANRCRQMVMEFNG